MDDYNVIVIVSDTFRRDQLRLVGNAQIHTPHLDRFAETATVFNYG
jgi:arylsulfatase A-like enzyme